MTMTMIVTMTLMMMTTMMVDQTTAHINTVLLEGESSRLR